MKTQRLLLNLYLLFFASISGSAQNDLFTAIKPYADGEQKFLYANFSENSDGTGSLESIAEVTIEIEKNRFDKNAGLKITRLDMKRNNVKSWRPLSDNLDHYTHPARYIRNEGSNQAENYIMIDKVLYSIWYCNSDCTDFKIQALYVPLIRAEKKEGKKKRGFLKKLGSKLSTAMGGNAHVLAQNDVNHRAKIKKYLSDMKALQKANPYSSKIKAEIAALKKDNDEENAEIQKFNEDYKNSDEYKEIMKRNAFFDGKKAEAAKTSLNINNKTGNAITIGTAGGKSLGTVLPGASNSFPCNEDIHLFKGGKPSRLLSKANSNCQEEVVVN